MAFWITTCFIVFLTNLLSFSQICMSLSLTRILLIWFVFFLNSAINFNNFYAHLAELPSMAVDYTQYMNALKERLFGSGLKKLSVNFVHSICYREVIDVKIFLYIGNFYFEFSITRTGFFKSATKTSSRTGKARQLPSIVPTITMTTNTIT